MKSFVLPDLAEGLEEAEILTWHVSEGEHVVVDQPLVSVETDKAVVEIPSPYSGRVISIHAGRGAIVKVGSPLIEFDDQKTSASISIVGELSETEKPVGKTITSQRQIGLSDKVQASPAVRNLARKLNVDLSQVFPTGKDQKVTREDVERAAKSLTDVGSGEALRGMRRAMAQRMTKSHLEVVRATVTEEALVDKWFKHENVTIRLVRAIAAAAKSEPALNAWYGSQTGELRIIERIDAGIAVDTPEGLIVPVLRNVGERENSDLMLALDRLRHDVEKRIVPPEELRGATITLSNFGMIGGMFANLVIVPPQVAIVGAGRIFQRLVFENNEIVSRAFLPLSLTFDHRVVTGGEATRFMMSLKKDLELDSESSK